MTPNPELRIGDAEREAAAASLREHYALGRLTLDELNERLDASFTARTQSQLDTITADLPHAQAPWGQAQQDIAPGPAPQVPVPQRPGGAGGIAAFVAGFFVLALVLLTLHNARDGHVGSGLFLLIPALIILRVALFRLFGRRRGWYQGSNHYHHHHHGDQGRAQGRAHGRDRGQSGGQWSDQHWSSGPGRGSDDSW